MSISSVRSEIRKSMETHSMCESPSISKAEMKSIISKAEADGRVVAGEARQIEDLIEKGLKTSPGAFMTEACPEHHAPAFLVDTGAVKEANAMFARNALPYGANEAKIRDKIEARLEQLELGPTIKKPSLTGFHGLVIQDQRLVDGPLTEAYVDPKKNKMFVKITGAGMGGPHTVGPFWHGPFSVDLKAKEISTATTKKLLKAAQQAIQSGSTEWSSAGVPLGVRMVRVPLFAEKHPDGFAYAALIPVGALAPGAPTSDPNKAKQFFLERTGGIAGMTTTAGPIAV